MLPGIFGKEFPTKLLQIISFFWGEGEGQNMGPDYGIGVCHQECVRLFAVIFIAQSAVVPDYETGLLSKERNCGC